MTFSVLFLGQHAVRMEENNYAERVYSMPCLFQSHAAVCARQYFIASSEAVNLHRHLARHKLLFACVLNNQSYS